MPIPPPPWKLAVATPAMMLPVAGEQSYEIKVDGWRIAAHVPGGMLHSRRGSDLTDRFPEILTASRALGSVVLDGELVALGPDRRLHFEGLYYGSRRRRALEMQLIYLAFDLLAHRGRDHRQLPYRERRARLQSLLARHQGGPVQLIAATDDGAQASRWISAEQTAVGIEGVVAKPVTSRYPLRGGPCGWIKVKYWEDTDAVVLGVLGTVRAPRALVLGQTGDDGQLHAVGLSTTLSRAALATLAGRLQAMPGTRRAPGIIAGVPGGTDFDYTPVRPGVVVEVRADAAHEWGRFRHRLKITRAKPPG